jgi:hypothetical protein
MKHKSSICLLKRIIISFGFFLFAIPLIATDVDVRPLLIEFNYDPSSSANDAITIKNTNGIIEEPEWWYNGGNFIEHKFAYIKGQSNRNIRVYFGSNCAEPMHLFITLTVIDGTGIGTLCNYLVPNYTRWSWVTLTLDGATPAYVGKHVCIWEWSIYAIPVGGSMCAATSVNTTEHEYFTVLAAPQAPMEVPWTEVLEHACVWASGQTSADIAVQNIVEGLYNGSGFKYNTVKGSSRYTGKTTDSFNLNHMITDLNSYSSNIIVNCYDMGKAADIMSSSLGCNTCYALSEPFGYINCIKAIGRVWSNNPFYKWNTEFSYPVYSSEPIVGEDDDEYSGRSSFGNHAFCELDSIIYDACLKVDTDGNPDHYLDVYGNPDGDGHIESWVYGWDWSTYKSKVIDNIPSSSPPSETAKYSYEVY